MYILKFIYSIKSIIWDTDISEVKQNYKIVTCFQLSLNWSLHISGTLTPVNVGTYTSQWSQTGEAILHSADV